MKKTTTRADQAAQRYSEILEAAKRLFAQRGYHSTSTRSICTAIGVADGLLYHYFPQGKQQILETIIKNEVDAKLKALQADFSKMPEDPDIEQFLYAVGNIILKNISGNADMLVILLRETHILEESYRQLIRNFFSYVIELLSAHFQTYIDTGAVKPLNADFMTMQFLSAFQHYAIMKLLGANHVAPLDDTTYLNLTVEHTLACWK